MFATKERYRDKNGVFFRSRYYFGHISFIGEIDWFYTIQWWIKKLLSLNPKEDIDNHNNSEFNF